VDKQAEIETLTGLASELEKKVDFININQLRLPIVLMLF
jgi:hypothetical protein